jgi:hypothetical protein
MLPRRSSCARCARSRSGALVVRAHTRARARAHAGPAPICANPGLIPPRLQGGLQSCHPPQAILSLCR